MNHTVTLSKLDRKRTTLLCNWGKSEMNPSKNEVISSNENLMSAQPISDLSRETVIQSFDLSVKSKFCWTMEVNINNK